MSLLIGSQGHDDTAAKVYSLPLPPDFPTLQNPPQVDLSVVVPQRPHVSLPVPFKPNLHRRPVTAPRPAVMTARAGKTKASLDDRIDILSRITTQVSPATEVFTTVSAILALVRVSDVAALHSSVDSRPLMIQQGQDD